MRAVILGAAVLATAAFLAVAPAAHAQYLGYPGTDPYAGAYGAYGAWPNGYGATGGYGGYRTAPYSHSSYNPYGYGVGPSSVFGSYGYGAAPSGLIPYGGTAYGLGGSGAVPYGYARYGGAGYGLGNYGPAPYGSASYGGGLAVTGPTLAVAGAVVPPLQQAFPSAGFRQNPPQLVSLPGNTYAVSSPLLFCGVDQAGTCQLMAQQLAEIAPGWATTILDGPQGYGIYLTYQPSS